jgi:mono/diheme cytochrome c family protein
MTIHPTRFLRLVLAAVAIGFIVAVAALSIPNASSAQDVQVNLDEVFRCVDTDKAVCAEARELILNNCTLCHTFAPIVLQQFDSAGWQGLLDRHRERVPQLSDEQIKTIHTYLSANFNQQLDPPELPASLLKAWTDY